MQPVTPTVLEGSNGGLKQANRATEGMMRMIMSSLETRYEVRVRNGQPSVQEDDRHAVWLWKRFQPGEDGSEQVLSAVPEVEPPVQVGIWSDVEEVSGG